MKHCNLPVSKKLFSWWEENEKMDPNHEDSWKHFDEPNRDVTVQIFKKHEIRSVTDEWWNIYHTNEKHIDLTRGDMNGRVYR